MEASQGLAGGGVGDREAEKRVVGLAQHPACRGIEQLDGDLDLDPFMEQLVGLEGLGGVECSPPARQQRRRQDEQGERPAARPGGHCSSQASTRKMPQMPRLKCIAG